MHQAHEDLPFELSKLKVKKSIGILLLLISGLLLNNPCAADEKKDYKIIIDKAITESNIVAAWLAYAGTHAHWYKEEFAKVFPNEKAYRNTLEAELEARTALVALWDEFSQKNPLLKDKYLEELSLVSKNGFLKEYLFYFYNHPEWKRDDLKMDDFMNWAKDNIPGHKLRTSAIVTDGQSNQLNK